MPLSSRAPADEVETQFPHWRVNARVIPLSNLLTSLGFGIAWPFLPLMVRGLGVETNLATWVGNIVLAFYVVSFVTNPIWGGVADHFGRKIMVLRATLGMGACMVITAFASTPLSFAVLLCVVGLFNGNSGASMALIVANTPPARMGTALALSQMGMLVGQTMGPAAGALLATLIPRHHWMFWVSGGMLLLAGLLTWVYVREVKQPAPGRWRLEWIGPLRQLLAVPRIGLLFLLAFVFAALWNGNITIMSLYTLQLLPPGAADSGAEAFWVGAVALALAVSGTIAMPLWGRVLDRHDPARVLAFATAAAVLTHLPLLVLQTPLELAIARAAFGLSAAAMQPAIIRLLKDHSPPGMDARAIAYATSFHFIAMGLAPFVAGQVGPPLGLRTYFALAIALTVAVLALWLRSARIIRP